MKPKTVSRGLEQEALITALHSIVSVY